MPDRPARTDRSVRKPQQHPDRSGCPARKPQQHPDRSGCPARKSSQRSTETPAAAALAKITLLYESRDKKLCLFEDAAGHLTAVRVHAGERF